MPGCLPCQLSSRVAHCLQSGSGLRRPGIERGLQTRVCRARESRLDCRVQSAESKLPRETSGESSAECREVPHGRDQMQRSDALVRCRPDRRSTVHASIRAIYKKGNPYFCSFRLHLSTSSRKCKVSFRYPKAGCTMLRAGQAPAGVRPFVERARIAHARGG